MSSIQIDIEYNCPACGQHYDRDDLCINENPVSGELGVKSITEVCWECGQKFTVQSSVIIETQVVV